MAKEKLIFNNTNSYEELVRLLEIELPYVNKYYFHEDAIEQALASFHTSDEKTRKRILTFANHVDKKMNFASQAHKNRYHKIPTILAGAIYLDLYPDTVCKLTPSELEILAKHSITLPLTFYKTATMYYTKELLAVIDEKGEDFMFKTDYIYLTEKYFNMGQTPEEVTEYFRKTPTKELTEEAFEYERKMIEEEMAKHESGGFRL